MTTYPYYQIETSIDTIRDDADEPLVFILCDDELCIKRDGAKAEPEKGLYELFEVYLTLDMENVLKLRDFLNFALPK